MHREIRKGITQAEFNDDASKILMLEILVIAIAAGMKTNSWWVGGGCFIALLVCIFIDTIAFYLAIVLSIGWAVIGWMIGNTFFNGDLGACVVISIIGLLAGLGIHAAGLQYARDL